jgi:hypothetical protein
MENSGQHSDLRSGERSRTKRKRIPAPRATFGEDRGYGRPDGVMWPSAGFEANQYSPAGEVAVFASLFQGLQRRWRRRRASRKHR